MSVSSKLVSGAWCVRRDINLSSPTPDSRVRAGFEPRFIASSVKLALNPPLTTPCFLLPAPYSLLPIQYGDRL
ncbi:hypothetical protein [Chroococcidiopsis sp.]|uniref:hypothetical protein n=1 Tax=Chroococcidiopsis sp. TaxID=3088168 RepID=UPI003F39FC50